MQRVSLLSILLAMSRIKQVSLPISSSMRRSATHPNHVWALDYQFDVTLGGASRSSTSPTSSRGSHSPTSSPTPSTPIARWRSSTAIVAERGAPTVHPLRQRPRADRQRPSGLVPIHRHRHELHRSGQPLAEPLGRVLRLPDARRAALHRAVRHPARGPSPCRRLARGVQHLPSALGSRHAHACRVRRSMEGPKPLQLT